MDPQPGDQVLYHTGLLQAFLHLSRSEQPVTLEICVAARVDTIDEVTSPHWETRDWPTQSGFLRQ